MSEDLLGKHLGPYQLQSVLGRGRIATVYRALRSVDGRIVALKVLPRLLSEDTTLAAQFVEDMQSIIRLEHFHILPIYDVGSAEGLPYIAMRFMEGGTLADWIERLEQIPPDSCVPIIQQVAAALDYAHKLDTIHQNVNPHNILIDAQGDAFLSDFSVPSLLDVKKALTGDTYAASPGYMAPEMLNPNAKPTPAVDIYGLGVTLFHMLTGVLPFRAESPEEQMRMHASEPVPSIQRFNPLLTQDQEIVILRALGKSPEDRFATAGAMAVELAKAAGVTVDAVRHVEVAGDQTPPYPDTGIDTRILKAEAEEEAEAEAEGEEAPHPTPLMAIEPERLRMRVQAPETEPLVEAAVPAGVEEEPATGRWDLREQARQRKARERVYRQVSTFGAPWYTIMLVTILLLIVWFVVGATIGFEARQQVNSITLVAIHSEQTRVVSATAQADAQTQAVQAAIAAVETATAAAPTMTPTATDTPTATLTPTTTPFGASMGRIALISDRDGDAEIYILDMDSGELRKVTNNDVEDAAPAWSPNGRWLAFESLDTLQGRHIFVANSEGQDIRELTKGFRVDRYPLWSVDSETLVFFSKEAGRYYIRSVTPDGVEQELLQLSLEIIPLDWAPDNRTLTVYGFTPDNLLEIQRIDIVTGLRTPITERVGLIEYVSFSPDRTKVLYTMRINGRWQLFMADTNCQFIHDCNRVRLTDDVYNYYTPRFSPDGTLILVTADRFNHLDLFVLDLEGELVRRLTESPFNEYDGVWQPVVTGP